MLHAISAKGPVDQSLTGEGPAHPHGVGTMPDEELGMSKPLLFFPNARQRPADDQIVTNDKISAKLDRGLYDTDASAVGCGVALCAIRHPHIAGTGHT